jgi:hypothetical protein
VDPDARHEPELVRLERREPGHLLQLRHQAPAAVPRLRLSRVPKTGRPRLAAGPLNPRLYGNVPAQTRTFTLVTGNGWHTGPEYEKKTVPLAVAGHATSAAALVMTGAAPMP